MDRHRIAIQNKISVLEESNSSLKDYTWLMQVCRCSANSISFESEASVTALLQYCFPLTKQQHQLHLSAFKSSLSSESQLDINQKFHHFSVSLAR